MPKQAGDPLLGQLLSERYLVRSKLGEGAMGAVYLADHVWLERPVAVKVVLGEAPVGARALRRLHREARAVARIRHPAVVAVYDYGETTEGWPFLVMEYVEGQTASRRFRYGASLAEILGAADSMLGGLAAAHDRGVLHRDLKPANMIARGGDPQQIVLLDFGIAAVLGDGRADEGRAAGPVSTLPGQERLTRFGSVVGTPLYMSPEQAQGWEATARSDLYSVGVILYEWIGGRPPFDGGVTEILHAHAFSPAPPLVPRPGLRLPAPLARLISRALEKDPVARWEDAHTMRAAVRDVIAHLAPDGAWTDSAPSLPSVAVAPLTESGFGSRTAFAPLDIPTPQATERLPGEPPFVGREAELRAVSTALERLRLGAGTLLRIRGERGVGKSRFCRSVLERLGRDAAFRVARTVGDPAGGAGPLRVLLEDLLELRGLGADAVARALRATSTRGGEEGLSDGEVDLLVRWLRPPPDGQATPEDARVGELLLPLLRLLADRGPVVLWLDDVPQCGGALHRTVQRLVLSQRIERIAVLALVTEDDGAADWFGDLAGDGVQELRLPRMGVADLEAVVAGVAPCAPELRAQVAALSGGSPLRAVQFVRHLLSVGRLIRGSDGWRAPVGEDLRGLLPVSLDQLFREQHEHALERSPSPALARRLLETAALLGDAWEMDLLAAALATQGDATERLALEEEVDRLVAAGIFAEPEGWSGDALAWDPPLRRDAALAPLRGTRRGRRLAQGLADAVLGWPSLAEGARARAVTELLLLAAAREAAWPHALLAGHHALAAGELAEAGRLFRLVIDGGGDRRGSALLGLAEVEIRAGDVGKAATTYGRALEAPLEGEERARALLGLGRGAWQQGQLDLAWRHLGLAEEALSALGSAAPVELRSRLLRTQAAVAADLPGMPRPEKAPGLVEASAPGPARCEAKKTLGILAELHGEPRDAARWFREALQDARRMGLRSDVAMILVDLSRIERRLGDVDRAASSLQEAMGLAGTLGLHAVAAEASNEWGELRRAAGALGEAVAAYERAAERWTLLGNERAVIAGLNLAVCAVEVGEPQRARVGLASIATRPGGVPTGLRAPWLLTGALVAAAMGEEAEARRLLRQGVDEECLRAPPHDDALAVVLEIGRRLRGAEREVQEALEAIRRAF
jgi:serine/threonine protein kinase/tetratricopeptide (TPR) repeat protein